MAEVFLGYTEEHGRRKPVAVKRLLPQLAQDQEIVDLFLAEAHLLLQFNHPNVVKAFEVGKVRGSYIMAMEYIHGASLEELLKRAKQCEQELSLDLLARIGSDVCDVLGYVHRFAQEDGTDRQVIHRDISPQNIMLTYAGRVKVLDFGVAKDLDSLSRTRPSALAGKTAYLSPEQVKQLPGLDQRTDIYSLGAVLFELATGRKPFVGGTELDTMLAIVKQPSPDPREEDHRIPDEFAELVMHAMDKDRERRFQTAEQMGAALLTFLEHRRAKTGQRELARCLRDLFPPKHAIRRQAAEDQPEEDRPAGEGDLDPAPAAAEAEPAPEAAAVPPATDVQLEPEQPEDVLRAAGTEGAAAEASPGPQPPGLLAAAAQPLTSEPPLPAPDPPAAEPGELFASIAGPRRRTWRWLLPLVALGGGAALAGVITWQLGRTKGDAQPDRAGPDHPVQAVAEAPVSPTPPAADEAPAGPEAPAADDEGTASDPPLVGVANKPPAGLARGGKWKGKWKGWQKKKQRARLAHKHPTGRAQAEPDLDPIEDENLPAQDEPARDEADRPVEAEAPAEPPEQPPDQATPVEVAGAQQPPVRPEPPPAADPPPKPTYQPPEVVQKRRIAGHDPDYPPMARQAKLRATVMVKIFIEPDGRVGFTKILKGHPVFDEAVLAAVRSWRFAPYSINGRPVGTYTVYKFVFQME